MSQYCIPNDNFYLDYWTSSEPTYEIFRPGKSPVKQTFVPTEKFRKELGALLDEFDGPVSPPFLVQEPDIVVHEETVVSPICVAQFPVISTVPDIMTFDVLNFEHEIIKTLPGKTISLFEPSAALLHSMVDYHLLSGDVRNISVICESNPAQYEHVVAQIKEPRIYVLTVDEIQGRNSALYCSLSISQGFRTAEQTTLMLQSLVTKFDHVYMWFPNKPYICKNKCALQFLTTRNTDGRNQDLYVTSTGSRFAVTDLELDYGDLCTYIGCPIVIPTKLNPGPAIFFFDIRHRVSAPYSYFPSKSPKYYDHVAKTAWHKPTPILHQELYDLEDWVFGIIPKDYVPAQIYVFDNWIHFRIVGSDQVYERKMAHSLTEHFFYGLVKSHGHDHYSLFIPGPVDTLHGRLSLSDFVLLTEKLDVQIPNFIPIVNEGFRKAVRRKHWVVALHSYSDVSTHILGNDVTMPLLRFVNPDKKYCYNGLTKTLVDRGTFRPVDYICDSGVISEEDRTFHDVDPLQAYVMFGGISMSSIDAMLYSKGTEPIDINEFLEMGNLTQAGINKLSKSFPRPLASVNNDDNRTIALLYLIRANIRKVRSKILTFDGTTTWNLQINHR